MKSGVYLIKNIANNKVYVGSSINVDKRWKDHKWYLKEGKHHSCHLQSAWDKYGEQSFTFEIIQEVLIPEHLLAYEQVYLDYYKSYEGDKGYNICKVAGSPLGMKHTEEARKKISEIHKGKIVSKETRKKLSEINKGKKLNEEHKKKLIEANKGKNRSEEARKKMSEATKGRKHTKETKQKIKSKQHTEE